MAKLLALLLLVLTLPLPAQASRAFHEPALDYILLPPGKDLTPEQALVSDRWQTLNEKSPNFGYVQDHLWLRFEVPDPELSVLEISYPHLDSIDFYLVRDQEIVTHESTGDRKPFDQRPVQHPHFLFPFQQKPGSQYQILLRVESEGSLQVPVELWSSRSFFEKAAVEIQLHAGYYGILITAICFNLFVFAALREPVYLLYVLSTLGYLLLVGSLNGITYQLLWPNNPAIQNTVMVLTVPFALVFTLLFSRSFLKLKKTGPRLDTLILITVSANLLVGAATLFMDYSSGSRITVALAIPSCLLLTIIGPVQWFRGNPQAVYYTLAWGALTLGSAISATNKYGLIPTNFLTTYGIQIGSALEVILLSLALAVRIYRERQDKLTSRESELKALEARRAAELRLMDQALHDPLTQLPNLSSFEMHLNSQIQRDSRKRYGVVMVHLTNLPSVTKTLGHRNTDRILELASKNYNAILQQIPGILPIEQTQEQSLCLAALNPQTFAFLVDADKAEASQRLILRSLEAIRYPVEFLGMQVPLAPQLGVAIFPDNGTDANTLVRRAVIAEGSDRARERGMAYYKQSRDAYSADRLTLVSELRHAIDNDELTLYLQPKLSLKSGRVEGVEALIRWLGREQPVRPDMLIALAEQSGLIKPLTRWVLKEALTIRNRLVEAGYNGSVSVNISPNNLREPDFAVFVQRLMQSFHAHRGAIIFEVTETSMMQDPVNSLKALNALNTAGIKLSIDDFGSGYSSLSYIKQLPASEIKIDRSLITDLADRQQDRVIVRTTIGMCQSLGYTVVAEGVEDEHTMNLLKDMDCDLIQGYYLSRPLPVEEIIGWLTNQPCRSRISAS